MSLKEKIKASPFLKKWVHRMLIPKNEARPRWWVRKFYNPFVHKRGKEVIVRSRARMDLLPFSPFEIGDNSVVEDFCTINNGVGAVAIGHHSQIGLGCTIIGPVKMGNYNMLAQNIVISGLNHNYEDPDMPIRLQGVSTQEIVIEDDVWIAANAVITAGVRIGKHSVIGGGSVVAKDIPPYSIAVGNPARVIKTYDFDKKEWVRVEKTKPKVTETK